MKVNIQHFGGRGSKGNIMTAVTRVNVGGHELFFGPNARENIANRGKGAAAIEAAKGEQISTNREITSATAPKTYEVVKQQNPDSTVFVQVGDFYETFNNDARDAANALDLVLTRRQQGSNETPMAGFPVRDADRYFDKLKKAGKKVKVVNYEPTAEKKGTGRF